MVMLGLGLTFFIAIHLLPSFKNLRTTLVARLGELKYKGIFSVISLLSFVLIVIGKANAPFIEVWQPPQMFSVATKLLMLPALIFLVAAYLPSNFKQNIRHPMLISVKIWALAHLLINGDLASMMLFGGFLAFAVIMMISANKRTEWTKPKKQSVLMDILVIVMGGAVYASLGIYHFELFGIPIM